MSPCCPHQPDEHEILSACQEVIHYPSEDYPCLCTGFEGDERCLRCEHPKKSHAVLRVCKPRSGEHCSCSRSSP